MHSEPHAYTCRVCLFFSSAPWALNNLEAYMVITLTLKIYEHEKCNIDMPLAQPFICFIWQNILSILSCFKMLFLKSVQLIYCYLSSLAPFSTWLLCHWIRGSIASEISWVLVIPQSPDSNILDTFSFVVAFIFLLVCFLKWSKKYSENKQWENLFI